MILHLDMDAFFAAIEQRDNPALAGKPVIVGGNTGRSVVCTASYEARKFGIHSAMPVFQAKKLCRDLIIVPVDHGKYSAVSRRLMTLLDQFSPLVEPVSIDEAYLDISGCRRLFGSYRDMALTIKKTVRTELDLTCSVGIAPFKYLAKIASDMDKPDGITIIEKDSAREFAMGLDIGKIPGVGKTAAGQMRQLKIHTLGDVQRFDPRFIMKKFGKFGSRLIELANGIDRSAVESTHIRKSISKEITLPSDTADREFIRQKILFLSQTVGRILRKNRMVCANVFIKLKFADFSQITRTRKTGSPICSSTAIYDQAVELFDQYTVRKKIRLIGVGVSSLQDESVPIQMALLGNEQAQGRKWEQVDQAVDHIMEKFGTDLVRKASLNQPFKEPS